MRLVAQPFQRHTSIPPLEERVAIGKQLALVRRRGGRAELDTFLHGHEPDVRPVVDELNDLVHLELVVHDWDLAWSKARDAGTSQADA